MEVEIKMGEDGCLEWDTIKHEWNPIPKGAAVSNSGVTYLGIEEIYHKFEEAEALHLWLDERGVPRTDSNGKEYSLVGRVMRYKEMS